MSTARNNAAGAHERRCRYASKRCENPRAVKRNGELHRFCEFHREKANMNQKRNDQKKKEGGGGVKRSESDDVGDAGDGDDPKTSTPARSLGEDDDEDDEDDDDDAFFRVEALDISQLDPDELDDSEIEELQALVVAGHLQDIIPDTDPEQRIEPS